MVTTARGRTIRHLWSPILTMVTNTYYELLLLRVCGCLSADSDFSYYGRSDASGPRPDMWGERPEWRTCKDGKEQSPINIVTANSTFVSDFYRLDTSYSPANGTFFIDSADILEVIWHHTGSVILGPFTRMLEFSLTLCMSSCRRLDEITSEQS